VPCWGKDEYVLGEMLSVWMLGEVVAEVGDDGDVYCTRSSADI
jgi:hypothetical protein